MRTSIMDRRRRSRIKKNFELPLTSMMDMLIIILVFLLKSYAANSVNFAASSKIQLPQSLAEEVPNDAPNVIIEPDSITFDGEKILNFTDLPQEGVKGSGYTVDKAQLTDREHRIVPLFDAMVRSREKAELLMSKAIFKNAQTGAVEQPKFQGVVVIQADKSVRYDVLRKIMFTAGAAGFKVFKLVTIRKDS